MLKIIVADDHPVIREGLRRIVAQSGNMSVVAEAADSQQVLEKVRRHSPDVLLLDISMPGRSGLEILDELKTKHPKVRILVLSQHPEERYASRVFRAGAAGYLAKDSASAELLGAIHKVAGGGKYVSATLAERLAANMGTDVSRQPHETLSDREFEVLRRVGNGETISEIAEDLSLSVKTISTYRTRILEKLALTKTAELIRYAIQHQLVTTDSKMPVSRPRR